MRAKNPVSFTKSTSQAQSTGLEVDEEAGTVNEEGQENEPLNNQDGGGDGPLAPVPQSTLMEKLSGGIAGVAVVTSVISIAMMPNPIVIAAGVSSAALAPYAWFQQTKLTDIKSLKDTHEALHREVETLQAENNRLRKNVDELADTVDRLGDIEDALDVITQTQGQSVAAFAEQVEENRAILQQMEKNLKANVLQNLFSVVMGSDKDGDLMIDDDEIEEVVTKMNSIKGVTVNKEAFRDAIISKGRSLDGVMQVVRGLIDDSENQDVFVLSNE